MNVNIIHSLIFVSFVQNFSIGFGLFFGFSIYISYNNFYQEKHCIKNAYRVNFLGNNFLHSCLTFCINSYHHFSYCGLIVCIFAIIVCHFSLKIITLIISADSLVERKFNLLNLHDFSMQFVWHMQICNREQFLS